MRSGGRLIPGRAGIADRVGCLDEKVALDACGGCPDFSWGLERSLY